MHTAYCIQIISSLAEYSATHCKLILDLFPNNTQIQFSWHLVDWLIIRSSLKSRSRSRSGSKSAELGKLDPAANDQVNNKGRWKEKISDGQKKNKKIDCLLTTNLRLIDDKLTTNRQPIDELVSWWNNGWMLKQNITVYKMWINWEIKIIKNSFLLKIY